VPPHDVPTLRAYIGTVRQLQLTMFIAAGRTCLTGCKPLIYFYDDAAVTFRFILQHPHKPAPSVITDGLPKREGFFHRRHVKILDADDIVVMDKVVRQFM